MRLFFALWPPPRVRRAAADVQRRLSLYARAVPSRQFHITLAFLGEVDAPGRERATAIAGGLSLPAVTLRLDRLGHFRRAGVAWLGCDSPPASLVTFQHRLASALADAGLAVEARTWLPHLTLYRDLRKPPARLSFDVIEWPVSAWCLVRSRPVRGGVEYDVIDSWTAVDEGEIRGGA